MACVTEYSAEQLNYYRICYITTDVLADGLRTVFKQEWDNRYNSTKGEWKDEPKNGLDFYNGESPRNQRRNFRLLATMINGNTAEWDCTMLFYAILFSDCIYSLSTTVKTNIHDLKNFRNEQFAHMPRGQLTDVEFQGAISKVQTAFQALGLSTSQIQGLRNQTSFRTDELRNVLRKIDDLEMELKEIEEQRRVLEDQLQRDISSFCFLPPKPSHDLANRDREVVQITQKLKWLKKTNESSVTYLYISGNPGSGKSQLAGLVARRYFDEAQEVPDIPSFVMTVNAESSPALLESYVTFARQLKCPEYAITNTLYCRDFNTDEKIANLKTLIAPKLVLFSSWLLIIDNVTSMSSMHAHFPANECWVRGQVLITTQDTASIPFTSSFIEHVSISEGLEPRDACSLLANLSGFSDDRMENEVAQALNYQPLALASAATYLRQVRRNKATAEIGWNDYLEKLSKGQRRTTEAILAETNPCYQKSMTTAISLAIETMAASDRILSHVFTFLSLCAMQPVHLDLAIDYLLAADKETETREVISLRIQRCSLLLLDEKESGVYIRTHYAVHEVINALMNELSEQKSLEAVSGALRSFNEFINDSSRINSDEHDSISSRKQLVPHLKSFILKIEDFFCTEKLPKILKEELFNIQGLPGMFGNLGQVAQNHLDFYTAKKYFHVALEITKCDKRFRGVDAAIANFHMGTIHQDFGEFHRAKKCFECELSIRLKEQGRKHVDIAATYGNLGNIHLGLGDLEKAKSYYELALVIIHDMGEHEHVHVATTYNNLGDVHSELGHPKQARIYYNHALRIRLKQFGPDHILVAATYGSLGNVSRQLGNLEQAKDYYDRALAIRTRKLGPEYIDVATTSNNLGIVYLMSDSLEQAKDYFDLALAINLNKLGPEHVHVAATYNNLGNVHVELGDPEKAKEYYDLALIIGQNLVDDEQLKDEGPKRPLRDRGTTCKIL